MSPIIFLVFGVSYAVLFAAAYLWVWNIKRKNERSPLADKLLRPPGETLRRKVEELNGDLAQAIIIVLIQPVWFFVVVFLLTKIPSGPSPLATLLIGGLATVAGLIVLVGPRKTGQVLMRVLR
jgi:hypothetical protein